MKKFICYLAIAVVLTFIVGVLVKKTNTQNALPTQAYIRVHIRANSNSDVDQEVKYAVKAAVVEYLTPIIAECETVEAAHNKIAQNLAGIDCVADKVLRQNGFYYGAKSRLNEEFFPTRAYADTVLNEGVYDALIVDLGSGLGNNWWCVVYPPLCFIGAENSSESGIVYKSKLVEIVNKWVR